MSAQDYSIATLSEAEKKAVSEVEDLFKQKTGKSCILIAWEGKS